MASAYAIPSYRKADQLRGRAADWYIKGRKAGRKYSDPYEWLDKHAHSEDDKEYFLMGFNDINTDDAVMIKTGKYPNPKPSATAGAVMLIESNGGVIVGIPSKRWAAAAYPTSPVANMAKKDPKKAAKMLAKDVAMDLKYAEAYPNVRANMDRLLAKLSSAGSKAVPNPRRSKGSKHNPYSGEMLNWGKKDWAAAAFKAGREFDKHASGVANARVVTYGFSKWMNSLPPGLPPRGKGITKPYLLKSFREGTQWDLSKR